MKKSTIIALLVITAAASSAATLGVQKLLAQLGAEAGIVILTDARCKDCDTSRLEAVLKSSFPDSQVKILDYGERRGSSLKTLLILGAWTMRTVRTVFSVFELAKEFERGVSCGRFFCFW